MRGIWIIRYGWCAKETKSSNSNSPDLYLPFLPSWPTNVYYSSITRSEMCMLFLRGPKRSCYIRSCNSCGLILIGHTSKPLFHDFHDYPTKRFVPMTPMKSNLPEHGSSVFFFNGSQRKPVANPNLSKSNEISQMLSTCDV